MIDGIGFKHETLTFPVGEMHIKRVYDYSVSHAQSHGVGVRFVFENNAEIVELILLHNALKHEGIKLSVLQMPYIPFARQDRVAVPGESFSLEAFANIINSLNIDRVEVVDPHSDVATALIKNCYVIQQHEIFEKYLRDVPAGYFLICPDGGARKKLNKLHDVTHVTLKCGGVVECSKVREPRTGAIKETKVYAEDLGGSDCYIVDDICDGGRTFIEIAKVLKTKNAGKIVLMVTHFFGTKGLDVFRGLIDEIYSINGRVL